MSRANLAIKPMKTIFTLALVFLLFRGVWASPLSEHVITAQPGGTLKELDKVLFPTRLDGVSANPTFRIVPKHRKNKENSQLFYTSGDFLSPQLVFGGGKDELVSRMSKTSLPYNLYLEANYNLLDKAGPVKLQDPNDYGRVLKMSSLGIAYPLTPTLTLDGRYVVVKSGGLEQASPLVGGTYKVNAATTISVSYPEITPENQNTIQAAQSQEAHPAAELKIHF